MASWAFSAMEISFGIRGGNVGGGEGDFARFYCGRRGGERSFLESFEKCVEKYKKRRGDQPPAEKKEDMLYCYMTG